MMQLYMYIMRREIWNHIIHGDGFFYNHEIVSEETYVAPRKCKRENATIKPDNIAESVTDNAPITPDNSAESVTDNATITPDNIAEGVKGTTRQ